MRPRLVCLAALLASVGISGEALSQEKGTLEPMRLPPLAHPEDPSTPAKQLCGRQAVPAALAARTIGFYSRGCFAGGQALPVNGPAWEVMRLSRNRNWGHPALLAFLQRFAQKVPIVSHWPGILVGDMSQPRGGPMLTGHASHQIGLDADIWFIPTPKRQSRRNAREEMSATHKVCADRPDIDRGVWAPTYLLVIRAAAQEPRVERIFVNGAIKKALCREAKGDRSWLAKIRPWYGHDYHFHVRITCPPGDSACTPQSPPPKSEGCASADLAYWFTDPVIPPKPSTAKPAPPITLSQLAA